MPFKVYNPTENLPSTIPPNLGSSVQSPLTRVELRRQEKEKAKAVKTITMTMEAFDTSLKLARLDERTKITETIVEQYSAAIAIVMRDKWGFGKKRLPRLVGQINDAFYSILAGYYSIDDVKQTLREEVDYNILK